MPRDIIENRFVLSCLAIGLVLIGSGGLFSVFSIDRVDTAASLVRVSSQVVMEANRLIDLVVEVEAASRGYLIDGHLSHLERLDQSRTRLREGVEHLASLLGGSPTQSENLAQLRAKLLERVEYADRLVRAHQSDPAASAALFKTRHGDELTAALRALVQKMRAEEDVLLHRRQAELRRQIRWSFAVTAATAVLGMILVAAAAWLAVSEAGRRREAERRAALRENLARTTLASIGDGALTVDVNGVIDWMNAAAESLFGGAQAAWVGRRVCEGLRLTDTDSGQALKCPVEVCLRSGETVRSVGSTSLTRVDGVAVPVAWTCAAIRDPHGRVSGAVLTLRDRTAERAAEAALQRSVAEIADLYHRAPCGYVSIDGQGRIKEVNATLLGWLGWERAQAVERSLEACFGVSSREALAAALQLLQETGAVENIELELVAQSGARRAVLLSATADRGVGERVGPARVTLFDVTERKRVQTERDRFFALSLDMFCIAGVDGYFHRVNPAFGQVLGWEEDEWKRRPFFDFVHPDDQLPTRQVMEALVVRHEAVRGFRNRYRHRDGSWRMLSWSAQAEMDGLIYASARDVTEQRQAELALESAKAAADAANRAKSQFLANMSHELRTPLNSILGLSETLLEGVGGSLTERQKKSVSTILGSGQHLLALINDILDLSKVEADRMELNVEPVVVEDLCRTSLSLVHSQAVRKRIQVEYENDGLTPDLLVDGRRLKQVLVNLLTNAVKFTPEGGRLGLTVTTQAERSEVTFLVWDQGIGISPADQVRLFQPFEQLDVELNRSQEGTGLGLALVSRLTALLGGSVSLESAVGEGSRFSVRIPRIQPPDAGATQVAAEPCTRWRRVLVIEDDPTAGEQLVRHLAELEIEGRLMTHADDVVAVVRREQPDLIFLDVLLPKESGWVALARLQDDPATRAIPVVVISVVDEPMKSLSMGAVAHFTKPISRPQLAAFLRGAPPPPETGWYSRRKGDSAFLARQGRVLLAEDNEANIETIGGYLKAKGWSLAYARDGTQAITSVQQQPPDIVLMDIHMPGMDGLAAIRALRADPAFRCLPIVALTALAMHGDRETCLAAGATEYVSKPVRLAELNELVTRLVTQAREAAGRGVAPGSGGGFGDNI